MPYATVLLRVDATEPTALPLPVIAGYLDRYGIRSHKVRVTSRDSGGERTTRIGLTLGADGKLPDTLAAIAAHASSEACTALEITGTATQPRVACRPDASENLHRDFNHINALTASQIDGFLNALEGVRLG